MKGNDSAALAVFDAVFARSDLVSVELVAAFRDRGYSRTVAAILARALNPFVLDCQFPRIPALLLTSIAQGNGSPSRRRLAGFVVLKQIKQT